MNVVMNILMKTVMTDDELLLSLTNTTTLNSFKKDHKAHITGLELGLETPFNFTEIQ